MTSKELETRRAFLLSERVLRGDSKERREITLKFGKYAVETLNTLRKDYEYMPLDCFIVGDNWKMLITWKPRATEAWEKVASQRNQNAAFGRTYLIQPWNDSPGDLRTESLRHLVHFVNNEPRANYIPRQMKNEFAVIDRTSVAFPLWEHEDIKYLNETPWGKIMKLEGYKTRVYVVTKDLVGPHTTDPYP